jgi:hypothetical protein
MLIAISVVHSKTSFKVKGRLPRPLSVIQRFPIVNDEDSQ